ncbi:Transcriptional regulator, AbiEi antitoxin, Type IV TA system [Lentzea fradiae]|uniref:Transcriptional regulator, AbiEi antitoxin, Type IV TA system n=2 Tax=Lentzea fradiae TaxID=200378 RepID=A0A1G7MPG8_9PSEU|nr:Transcriptional regulator, AbiEi antitoxin, Type IV TA system [Lentzea fradiae]
MKLISGFTADQWGMVTAQQAKSLGISRSTLHRLETAGHLDRVRHGVYASTAAAITASRDQKAAWLALNPSTPAWERPLLDPDGGVLSHQAAINLHGLGELPADRMTFTTPRRRTSRDPDLWFKRAQLAETDVTLVDGLPATTVLRTICDLLDQHIDGSHIATIIREGVITNLVHLDDLTEAIGPYALRYGVRRPGDGLALLEHLLAEIGTSVEDLVTRPAPVFPHGHAVATALAAMLKDSHVSSHDFPRVANGLAEAAAQASHLRATLAESAARGMNASMTHAMLSALQKHKIPTIPPISNAILQILRNSTVPYINQTAQIAAGLGIRAPHEGS